jgi:hypothetical protein
MAKLTERLRKGAQTLLESAGDLQERIRERARAIWEREGRPEGRHEEHWRQAEKETNAENAAGQAEREARATNPKKAKAPDKVKVKSPAAGPATRRRPKESAPTSDAATAQELTEKTRSSKSRDPGNAPATGTGKTRRPNA